MVEYPRFNLFWYAFSVISEGNSKGMEKSINLTELLCDITGQAFESLPFDESVRKLLPNC
jgi:hypothetical protein